MSARVACLLLACLAGGCAASGPRFVAPDPTVDADLDGVHDGADDCPGTRLARAIDARGCTPLDGPLEGVDFLPGSAALGAEARRALEPLVEALRAHPEVVLEVQGHTDNRGSAADNLVLSKRRVMAVVRFLVSSRIEPARLVPFGYGESRPRAGNATAEGRAANRRIEVRPLAR